MVAWEIKRGEWTTEAEYMEQAREYWTRCFYFPTGTQRTDELLITDEELIRSIDRMIEQRAASEPDDICGLKTFAGLDILDFGCGVGIDAVTIMENRARQLTLCDIIQSNLDVAIRNLGVRRFTSVQTFLMNKISDLKNLGTYDIVYAKGSLHEIPPEFAKRVVRQLSRHVRPEGRFVAMTYADGPQSQPEGPYTCGYSLEGLKELFSPMVISDHKVYNAGYFQVCTAVHPKKGKKVAMEVQKS